jgi:hypothetical protein
LKRTTKLLIAILVFGISFSFYKAFTGQDGSGLYDLFDAIVYSSMAIFLASMAILIFNIRNYKNHWDTALFLLLGLPFTFSAIRGAIDEYNYNRTPNLTAKYEMPIGREQYLLDSTNIKLAIDSLIQIRNRTYGGPDILYGTIDTIIYSQKGDKIFVFYITKFEPNHLGNDLDPDYLVADKRDGVSWQLTDARQNFSGSFHDIETLKKEVRKYYFNQFTFLDRDSTADNYIWKIIM